MKKTPSSRHVSIVVPSPEAVGRLARDPDWSATIVDVVKSPGACGKAVKRRPSQSTLDVMPLHQKQALMAWLTTGGKHGQGITYKEARAKLKTEFGVQVSSKNLCRFYQRHQRTPIPAVSALLSPDRETLTLRINLSLLPAASS